MSRAAADLVANNEAFFTIVCSDTPEDAKLVQIQEFMKEKKNHVNVGFCNTNYVCA